MPVFALSEAVVFPPPQLASPEGLLAVGGDLAVDRLLLAYRSGIFPWYADDQPILWWSPDPRLVLYPREIHIPHRLRRTVNSEKFRITMDRAFEQVIVKCATVPRKREKGTWIVGEMIQAYCRLHEAGFAHSLEAWENRQLVGGLYGVSLGGCFFGESMFATCRDASKVAFVTLVAYALRHGFSMIDCQVPTGHLERFGARKVPRKQFLKGLEKALKHPTHRGKWDVGQAAADAAGGCVSVDKPLVSD